MSENKEKCVKINIENWLYKKMCVGCEREKICHNNCECCEKFAENLLCLVFGFECDYTYDFELEKRDYTYDFEFEDFELEKELNANKES